MIFVASPFGMNLIAFNELHLSNTLVKLAKDVNVRFYPSYVLHIRWLLVSHEKNIKQSRKKLTLPLMGENSVTIFAV